MPLGNKLEGLQISEGCDTADSGSPESRNHQRGVDLRYAEGVGRSFGGPPEPEFGWNRDLRACRGQGGAWSEPEIGIRVGFRGKFREFFFWVSFVA